MRLRVLLQLLWNSIEEYYLWILLIWVFAYFIWKKKKGKRSFLSFSALVYVAEFLYVTLLSREIGTEMDYQLSFLWEYRLAFEIREGKLVVQSMAWVEQIRDNILLFVPFGIFAGEFLERRNGKEASWKRTLAIGFIASATVEVLQLVFRIGLFELDDMLNNTIGIGIGYLIYRVGRYI